MAAAAVLIGFSWPALPALAGEEIAATTSAVAPASAGVRGHEGAEETGAEHKEREIVLGLGFTGLEGFSHGVGFPHWGVAGFAEAPAVEGLLDVELGLRCLSAKNAFVVPIDLLFKHSFKFSRLFEPYVGFGPTLVIEREHKEREETASGEPESKQHSFVFWGVAASAGSYFWVRPEYGVFAELDYNCVWEHGSPVHELGFTVGFVFRL
jgi:hypothetical protein